MRPRAWLGGLLVLAGLFALVAGPHPGSTATYLLFVLSWLACTGLAFVGPPSIAYTALAAMWTLGFPLKLAAHRMLDYPWQEPIGSFADTPGHWDAALLLAAAGLAGAAAARLVTLRLPTPRLAGRVPAWYRHKPGAVWLAVALGLVAAATLNVWGSFYRIGIHPAFALPLKGHVLVAWIVALGGGLGVAALVDWERRRTTTTAPDRRGVLMLAVCGEAILSSTAALSRGIVLFRLVPYWLLWVHRVAGRLLEGSRPTLSFAAACTAAMALTLALVSMDRAVRFTAAARDAGALPAATGPTVGAADEATHDPTATAQPFVPSRGRIVMVQLRNLLVDRWVGLEGVMAVSSATERPSLLAALGERPDAGVDGWFQRVAQPVYVRMEGFTFLTLAGPMALLAVAGRPLAVFGGVWLGVGGLLVMEWVVRRGAAGPHLPAMASVALANYFVQMNTLYAFVVFLAELGVTCAALWALGTWRATAGPARPEARP